MQRTSLSEMNVAGVVMGGGVSYTKTHENEGIGAKLEPSSVISLPPSGAGEGTSHGVKESTTGGSALLKTVRVAGSDHSPPPSCVRRRERVPICASTSGSAQLASPPCTKTATTSASQPSSPPLNLQRSAPAVGARLVAWMVSGDGAARSMSAPCCSKELLEGSTSSSVGGALAS